MKNQLFIIGIICIAIMASCKKENPLVKEIIPAENTKDIIAKSGFTWENSRNINFTISVSNSRFPTSIHVISIFDGNPTAGGNLISKGSATTVEAFKSKIYLPNHFQEVYVVGAFPNGVKVTQKLIINNSNLNLTIGL